MSKIFSWNANSIRIRLNELERIVKEHSPDVICIQEVKAKEEDFPFEDIKALGFKHIALYGMAGYNGVAILSKQPLTNIKRYDWAGKADARHISAITDQGIEIHNIYIPAGGDIPDVSQNPAFARKLQFMEELSDFFAQNCEQNRNKRLLVCGDFNVAPLENDVWNHKQMLKIISHTPVEVSRLNRLKNSLDFVDAIRLFHPEPEKIFTWWSYRNPNWQINNKGRRLDHVWVSPCLKDRIVSVKICKFMRAQERPSDHVPVIVEIKK